jgi:hypothetical protein
MVPCLCGVQQRDAFPLFQLLVSKYKTFTDRDGSFEMVCVCVCRRPSPSRCTLTVRSLRVTPSRWMLPLLVQLLSIIQRRFYPHSVPPSPIDALMSMFMGTGGAAASPRA